MPPITIKSSGKKLVTTFGKPSSKRIFVPTKLFKTIIITFDANKNTPTKLSTLDMPIAYYLELLSLLTLHHFLIARLS